MSDVRPNFNRSFTDQIRCMSSHLSPLRRTLHYRTFSTNAVLQSVRRQGQAKRRSKPPPRPQNPLPKTASRIDALIKELEASAKTATHSPPTQDSATAPKASSPPPIVIRSPLTDPDRLKRYAELHPKAPEQRPHTPFHSALIKNPFGESNLPYYIYRAKSC